MAKKYLYIEDDGIQKAGALDLDGAPGTLYHTFTVMDDLSTLGYTGDPNDCNPSNNPGEQLLYNAGVGTWFVDKAANPYVIWVKEQDVPGGNWTLVTNIDTPLDGGNFT